MTYCLAIKVEEGLVCLADGRLTAGSQLSLARKASLHGGTPPSYCIMCSGLRSLRDKVMVYFEQPRSDAPQSFRNMTDVLSHLSNCIRQVAEEDRAALEQSGLPYDLHMIVAGKLADDADGGLYLVYPEGNWISADGRQPYLSIGATSYAKSVLDAALRPDMSMEKALKLALLAFKSTRRSSGDVGYPLDVLTLGSDGQWRQREFVETDLLDLGRWWEASLAGMIETMPELMSLSALLPEAAPAGKKVQHAKPAPTQLAAKNGSSSQSS